MSIKTVHILHLFSLDDLKLFGRTKDEHAFLHQSKKSKDIGMQFSIDKCATIVIKTGKILGDNWIQLNNEDLKKALVPEEGCKYLEN